MSAAPKPTSPSPEEEGAPRAVLYLRVSTKEQAQGGTGTEGFSIPTQRLVARQKAESLSAVVVQEFVDAGESARSADRPGLQAMLDYIKTERVDFVIVHKIDRLARNRVDDLQITLAFDAAGARLVSCSEDIDNRTPSGKLTHGVMALIAEWYSSNLSSEVKTKTLEKVRQGGTPFKAPIGYRNVRVVERGRETRTVEVDVERAPLVQWAFEAYGSGNWSIRALTAALEDLGLTTTGSKHYAEKPLPISTVNRILRNHYYIGTVHWQGVDYPGSHPKLISRELFDKVQQTLEARSVAGERDRLHNHYLKGSIWCGQCGSRLIVSHAKNRHGTVYPYFLCIGRHQKRTDCTQRSMPVALVEAHVADHWRTIELRKSEIDALRGDLDEALASARSTLDRDMRRARRERQRLSEEQAKLLRAYYDDALPLELMKQEQARLERALQQADQRIETGAAAVDEVSANLGRCLDLMSDCHATYASAADSVRRHMNQAIFRKLYIDEEGIVRHELEEPFATLHDPQLRDTADLGEPTAEQPQWLTNGSWWQGSNDEIEHAGRTQFVRMIDGTCIRRADKGLNRTGLNESYVVPPAGLEPALGRV